MGYLVYDGQGRLAAVARSQDGATTYSYDGSGALIRVSPVPAGLNALGFTPPIGTPGQRMRVVCSGLPSGITPALVSLNGVPLQVLDADDSSLVVALPPQAVPGEILIQADGEVTARQLDVRAPVPPPVIDSVSPTIGSAGEPLQIRGQALRPGAEQTSVFLNETRAVVREADDQVLVVEIPPASIGGRVTVTTGGGTAASSDDVLVLEDGIEEGPVLRTNLGAGTTVDMTGRSGRTVLVDGSAGKWIDAVLRSVVSVGDAAVVVGLTVTDPLGMALGEESDSEFVHVGPVPLEASGTHCCRIRPLLGAPLTSVELEVTTSFLDEMVAGAATPYVSDGSRSVVLTEAIPDSVSSVEITELEVQLDVLNVSVVDEFGNRLRGRTVGASGGVVNFRDPQEPAGLQRRLIIRSEFGHPWRAEIRPLA